CCALCGWFRRNHLGVGNQCRLTNSLVCVCYVEWCFSGLGSIGGADLGSSHYTIAKTTRSIRNSQYRWLCS
ncbi:hypothetical protein, partial [Salinicola rhizosphaerae]|uniref:hypothetical protein n=1 Tax=Salinicola rhizosphaerae TaxID=1443141 RepID=UPI00188D0458